MKEMRKSVRAALEAKGRFAEAATKAERARQESYQRIAEGYHAVAKHLISEMNVEALSEEPMTRFRSLDLKKQVLPVLVLPNQKSS